MRQTPVEVASFIQVQQFLVSLFIDNVKSDNLYVVWQTNDPNDTPLSSSHAFARNITDHTNVVFRLCACMFTV